MTQHFAKALICVLCLQYFATCYKIAFITEDYSHYAPMVPVAVKLAAQGHKITFHCAKPTWNRIQRTLTPAGVIWTPIESSMPERKDVIKALMPVPYSVLAVLFPAMLSNALFEVTRPMYDEISQTLGRFPDDIPDVFVMDFFSFSLYDIPRKFGKPYLTLAPGIPSEFMLPPSITPYAAIPTGTLVPSGDKRSLLQHATVFAIRALRTHSLAVVTAALNARRLLARLPLLSWPFDGLWGAPILIASVPSTHDPAAIPDSAAVTWLGALEATGSPAQSGDAAILAWLDSRAAEGRSVVYASMGTELELSAELVTGPIHPPADTATAALVPARIELFDPALPRPHPSADTAAAVSRREGRLGRKRGRW